ncbi:class F sortase [Streptomyces sp. L2]|uniref:class F sortase n=1 Tax=Streptomyces sp. L2 TaxID=2162665 RepID=UPI0010110A13|nr:class F sortase [Streptomyces sp. L2]
MAAAPSSPTPDEPAPDEPASRGGGRLTLWGVAIAVVALGMFGGHKGTDPTSEASRVDGAKASAPAVPTSPSTGPTGSARAAAPLPRSAPTRLLIPKISVNAPFTVLVTNASDQLQPPPADNTNLVGWYSAGVSPGETGTAVIAGHVDTKTSAAVFANLYLLKPGDTFSVERADGRTATFVVDDAENFDKDNFPSKRVYADADRPEVRLITCSGAYDHTAKDYTENLVVFAHLV